MLFVAFYLAFLEGLPPEPNTVSWSGVYGGLSPLGALKNKTVRLHPCQSAAIVLGYYVNSIFV